MKRNSVRTRGLIGAVLAALALGISSVPLTAHAADINIFDSDPHLPAGATNLAQGKQAASSSAYEMGNEGWATSFINDGRIGTGSLAYGWSTNPIGNQGTPVTAPAWVRLDLLVPSSISRVAVWPRMDAGKVGQGFPVDYAVEVSADGSTWTAAATRTGNTNVTTAQVIDFTPATGRYIRVNATLRAPGGPDGPLVQLAELAVYGNAIGSSWATDKPALELLPGESDVIVPANNGIAADPSLLTWASSDPAVATVSATGQVTAVALGSTTITATPAAGDPLSVPVTVIAERVDTDSEFLISAFWPPTPEYTNAEQYDAMAEAHIDYIQNVSTSELQGKETNMRMATLAAERGMRVGVSDPRLNRSETLTDAQIRAAVAEYKNVPGVGGFYMRDEPYNANPFGRVHRAMKAEAPWLYPYLNFLPSGVYPSRATFESQVDDYAELAGTAEVDYLTYDRYPFGNAPGSLDYAGMFDNMDAMRTVGVENGVKTGLYIQSIGVTDANGNPGGFRRTNAAEIRYEVNAALAFGFKHISYFTWFTPTARGEYFTHGIIAPDGTRTDLYEPVKQLNAEVKAMGPTLMGLESVEVYANGPRVASYGMKPVPAGFVGHFAADDDVLVSRMVRTSDGNQFLMVVNNNFQASQVVDLTLHPSVKNVQEVNRSTGNPKPIKAKNGRFQFTLAKGDAVLLALHGKKAVMETPVVLPSNVALNANVTAATSVGDGGWYMDKLTDGERFGTALSRGWKPTTVAAGVPTVVDLDLRTPRAINRVDLYATGSVFSFGRAFPKGTTLEVSADGTTWSTVAATTLAQPAVGVAQPSITFAPVTARYLRFTFDDYRLVDGKPALELGEIEVYHDNGTLPGPVAYVPVVDQTPWTPGKNVAQGMPVEVSSSTEAAIWGWSSAFVNDGQAGPTATTNGWTSQVGRNRVPDSTEWAAIYLGGTYNLEKVVIYPRNAATDQANAGRGFPSRYQVEVSTDGVTWTVAKAVTGDTAISAAPRTVTLDAPAKATFIRVVGTRLKLANPAADGYLMQLGEIQAFGTPA